MRDLQTQQERRFFDLTERTLLIENLIPSRRYELTATAIGVEDRRSSVSESLVAVTGKQKDYLRSNLDIIKTLFLNQNCFPTFTTLTICYYFRSEIVLLIYHTISWTKKIECLRGLTLT